MVVLCINFCALNAVNISPLSNFAVNFFGILFNIRVYRNRTCTVYVTLPIRARALGRARTGRRASARCRARARGQARARSRARTACSRVQITGAHTDTEACTVTGA